MGSCGAVRTLAVRPELSDMPLVAGTPTDSLPGWNRADDILEASGAVSMLPLSVTTLRVGGNRPRRKRATQW